MSSGKPLPGFEDRAPPDRYCDLILTGGVTSAIAYPGAIFALATAYRFNSIGGSSSGAGTAALAAAAEYRRRHGSPEGFRLLLERTAEVADVKEDGKTLLEWLFQPAADCGRLFAALVPGFASPVNKGKLVSMHVAKVYGSRGLVLAIGATATAGALAHAVHALLGWPAPTPGVLTGAAFMIAWALFALWLVYVDVRRMVNRDYGLCTGYERSPGAAQPPLTEWLHALIQEIAGRRPDQAPLTFHDLATAPGSPRDTLGDASPPGAVSINLQMYTANLTHGRPYVFPQERTGSAGAHANAPPEAEADALYFRPWELRRLFPADVIEHMKTDPVTGASNRYVGSVVPDEPRRERAFWEHWWPSSSPRTADDEADNTLWRLPREHLPILVAARMSISFPVLFSGVPLWAMERKNQSLDADDGQHNRVFRRCVFSDGSLCSNFPIHLFDSWLPAWPTFGISLQERVPDPANPPPRQRLWKRAATRDVTVTLPDDHRAGRHNRWNNFDYEPGASARLFSFVNAMLSTTMNWSDATLARLPGVRDRVAEVTLEPGIGGLNIRMTPGQIRKLADGGADAGVELLKRFAGRGRTRAGELADGWNEHRWVRFNVLRDSLTAGLAGLTWSASQRRYAKPIRELIREATREPPLAGDATSQIHAAQAAALEAVLNALMQAERALTRPTVTQPYAPSPRPAMRVRPPL